MAPFFGTSLASGTSLRWRARPVEVCGVIDVASFLGVVEMAAMDWIGTMRAVGFARIESQYARGWI